MCQSRRTWWLVEICSICTVVSIVIAKITLISGQVYLLRGNRKAELLHSAPLLRVEWPYRRLTGWLLYGPTVLLFSSSPPSRVYTSLFPFSHSPLARDQEQFYFKFDSSSFFPHTSLDARVLFFLKNSIRNLLKAGSTRPDRELWRTVRVLW